MIGAGAGGLTAIKNLREHGFDVDCYERETGVGGAWNWRHDRSPVYASTHLISSKPFTQFPDFPMPDAWPDYPHHSQVLAYLERYADHFELRDAHLVRHRGGQGRAGRRTSRWDVTTRSARRRRRRAHPAVRGRGRRQRAQLVARSCPTYEGLDDFTGKVIHASAYKDAAQLRGRGCWSSAPATPAATSRSRRPSRPPRCWHSTRRGYWYAPKYVFGRPADQVNDLMLGAAAAAAAAPVAASTARCGSPSATCTRFGLPTPDHKVVRDAPDRQQPARLLRRATARITPVPDVARFDRQRAWS